MARARAVLHSVVRKVTTGQTRCPNSNDNNKNITTTAFTVAVTPASSPPPIHWNVERKCTPTRPSPNHAPGAGLAEKSGCSSQGIFLSPGEVECFSDYMTLWMPQSHAEGLRQWLGRELQLPGPWRSAPHLDPLLAQCGYFLHPTPDGDFVFRALYSACFVQKEAVFLIAHQPSSAVHLLPAPAGSCLLTDDAPAPNEGDCLLFVLQVSRSLPPGSSSGQHSWLLSLRGELVASLEDASLIGLDVDTNTTTITVQSPRPELLQRREVLNTSTELLPLWLVGGHSAYSLEATCPPVSSQAEREVFVHIPKQRLGLVQRGPDIKDSLNLRSLRVLQSSTFRVTESPDLVVVSIPAAGLLQVQPCQDDQGAPGTQAFSRVDLSLAFVEAATPALWTAENFFQCVGSGTELPDSAAAPRTAPSPQPPGPEILPVGMPSAVSSPLQPAGARAEMGARPTGKPPGLKFLPSPADKLALVIPGDPRTPQRSAPPPPAAAPQRDLPAPPRGQGAVA
ncbi:ciliated left-right organizer ZP-N domains-containing protein [Tenrec ecaudatus]|uniref:ciliated left-right organizer ZP-N domains-containing protein n=1 Tax=Tenrec ecaudatus TaxID=94439 RepID=UPI003F59BC4E